MIIDSERGIGASSALEDAAEELRRAGATLITPGIDSFWRGYDELLEPIPGPRYDGLNELHDGEIVLGFLGRSHLGDVVCMSSLPRRLKEQYNCRVFSVRHRATHAVLANNPFLDGFRNEDRVSLSDAGHGPGQITQKLERYFGLSISPFPRGEIYLTHDELKWAWEFRSMLPRDRPVAVVCAGSLTDSTVVPSGSLGWQRWVDAIASTFTVVQIAVTQVSCVEQLTRLTPGNKAAWRPDHILDGCLVHENLAPRQFFALFAVADLFLGTNSGAMHVAAAFEVPAIVVLGARKYPSPPSFPDRIQGNRWRHESFLYPYHAFLMV